MENNLHSYIFSLKTHELLQTSGYNLQNKSRMRLNAPYVIHRVFAYVCFRYYEERKAMAGFATATDDNRLHFKDTASAFSTTNTKTSMNTWLNAWKGCVDTGGLRPSSLMWG